MKIYTCTLIFLALLFFSSCSSQKVLNRYADTQIVFGNGGGFTRQSSEYILNTDGEILFVKGIEKDTVVLSPLSKKTTVNIFKKFSESGIDTLTFNHPGDRYYFIKEVKTEVLHQVIWGDPSYTTPAEVDDLYKLLMSTINNN